MLYAQKDFEPVGGKVVAYFYDIFFQLWKIGLEADLRKIILRYPNAELWVNLFGIIKKQFIIYRYSVIR